MKWTAFALVAALAVGVVGCGEKGTVQGKDDKKLTLTAPANTSIKQGGTETVTVKIKREHFDEPVTVSFDNLPKGVSVKETDMKFDKGATERKFTLEAKDDATVEDGQEVKVTAKGPGDLKITEPFKLDVKKK